MTRLLSPEGEPPSENPSAPPTSSATPATPAPDAQGPPDPSAFPVHPGMPGLTVAARVLLFFSGGLWALTALAMLAWGLASEYDDVPDDFALGFGVLYCLISGGMAALHTVPASLFGKGRVATRVVAIVAASLSAFFLFLGGLNSLGPIEVVTAFPWLAVSVCTLVFCSVRTSGEWFARAD